MILQPQTKKARMFINTTLKCRRNRSRYIQTPYPKTFILLHYVSSIEYKLKKMLESFAELIICCAENV